MTADSSRARLFSYGGVSGYLIHPKKAGGDVPVALGHTALVSPWRDDDVHRHEVATEIFILLQGELLFLIGNSALTLRSGEILLVRSGVPHAIVGGAGRIEHFGLRAPAVDDRQSLYKRPALLPLVSHDEPRALRREWGYRIPLIDDGNQNCWLLGAGGARFDCDHLALAYGHLHTAEAAAAFRDRDRLHAHTDSWEIYVVLQGHMSLQVDARLVTVETDHVLEVSWRLSRGSGPADAICFTVRVPLIRDDKIECEAIDASDRTSGQTGKGLVRG